MPMGNDRTKCRDGKDEVGKAFDEKGDECTTEDGCVKKASRVVSASLSQKPPGSEENQEAASGSEREIGGRKWSKKTREKVCS